jgi:5-methylcytosine-specific restriction endonuclease McrA
MAITVVRAYSISDRLIRPEDGFNEVSRSKRGLPSPVGALTNLRAHPSANGPALSIEITLKDGPKRQTIIMPLEQFISADEYKRSLDAPLCFEQLETKDEGAKLGAYWIYRDALYVTNRDPRPSDVDEVVLRIKSLHFKQSEVINRLREEVANFEASQRQATSSAVRRLIPDDVKMLVWARDGGMCVKCGATRDLHFDHIIALSRGGGDHAENIQLLCRTCNLAKSDRLV